MPEASRDATVHLRLQRARLGVGIDDPGLATLRAHLGRLRRLGAAIKDGGVH